jgi:putative oxidoreductase
MLSIFPQLFDFQIYGALILRLALAAVFIVHGYPKLFGRTTETAVFFESVGIRPGKFWTILVGIAEFFGGILLIAGLGVQVVALLLAVDMFVAIWKVKFKMGFVNGWGFDFVLLAILLSLLVLGPGAYSIDLPL